MAHGAPRLFCAVSRIVARSENYEMDIVLDVNSELYPLEVNQKVLLVLVKTVRPSALLSAYVGLPGLMSARAAAQP